jgi:hypothetical protein
MFKRAGRRLLVSPWFAAGAGVVIATGAIIYVPHTNLDFGNAINVIHCKQAECRQSVPEQAPGMAAGIGGEQITVSPSAPTVPVGMTFSYQVLYQSEYDFSIQITVRARQDPGPWKLSFVIPGARHVYVYGAPAQLFGLDGVTVSSVGARTQSASFAQISGLEFGGAGESSQYGYILQFQVRGMGTPGTPSQCSYNGALCTFKGLRVLAPAGLPGSE